MKIQSWFSLGWTDLNSLLSKGLSNVFSRTTIQNHQFFSAQPSFWNNSHICSVQLSSVLSLSFVWLFATPWIAACQASLSITNSRSSLRLTSIELVMPSSHLILCRPLFPCSQSLPVLESFPMSQLFTWVGQSTGVSPSASFLPKKSQGWSSLEWTSWISFQSKGLSREKCY